MVDVLRGESRIRSQVNRAFGLLGSFALAAAAAFALTINAAFYESFDGMHLGPVLMILVLLHVIRYGRIFFSREFVAYALFTVYMFIQTLWTPDRWLALNTLVPATNFVVILVLFGSLIIYHQLHAVLAGMLAGLLLGAFLHTLIAGFPFVWPPAFSYNAVAAIYLFGLFITLLLGCYRRSRGVLLLIGLTLLLLIVATTSIKTSLGLLVGALGAGLFYFRHFARGVRRSAVGLVMLGGVLGYVLLSNDVLVDRIQGGIDRVRLGVEVLQAREGLPGLSSFDKRTTWSGDGLRGWTENPIFGHGVEAFRARYGVTSHATVVDLLYNSGLLGTALFYSVFFSIIWRLFPVSMPKYPENKSTACSSRLG